MNRYWNNLVKPVCLTAFFSFPAFSAPDQLLFFDNAFQFDVYDPFGIFHQMENPDAMMDEEAPAVVSFIQQAREYLEIEIYEMRNEQVKNAVLAAISRGVQVRIVAEPDPVGNGCDAFSRFGEGNRNCEESAAFTQKFNTLSKKLSRHSGKSSKIMYFNKNLCWDPVKEKQKFCFQHGKMVVRDRQFVLLSTGNFNSSGICDQKYRGDNNCNRDYTVVLDDSKTAKAMRAVFELDFKEATSCDVPPKIPRANNVIRKFTEGRCYGSEKDTDPLLHQKSIAAALKKHQVADSLTVSPVSASRITNLLKSAKKSIRIQAQYLKDPEWHAALLDAARRRVKIQITLASFCHFNQSNGVGFVEYKSLFGPSGYFTRWLDPILGNRKSRTSIRVFNRGIPEALSGKLGYQHAKVFVIDDKIAWVGSVNGSFTSTSINREFGVILMDREAVIHFARALEKDHENSVSLEEHIPNRSTDHTGYFYPVGSCKLFEKKKKEPDSDKHSNKWIEDWESESD